MSILLTILVSLIVGGACIKKPLPPPPPSWEKGFVLLVESPVGLGKLIRKTTAGVPQTTHQQSVLEEEKSNNNYRNYKFSLLCVMCVQHCIKPNTHCSHTTLSKKTNKILNQLINPSVNKFGMHKSFINDHVLHQKQWGWNEYSERDELKRKNQIIHIFTWNYPSHNRHNQSLSQKKINSGIKLKFHGNLIQYSINYRSYIISI